MGKRLVVKEALKLYFKVGNEKQIEVIIKAVSMRLSEKTDQYAENLQEVMELSSKAAAVA